MQLNATTMVLSVDVGVSLEDNAWIQQETTSMGLAGEFLTYQRPGLAAGDAAVSFSLAGEPEQRAVVDANGNSAVVRDDTSELLLGGLALMVVVVAGLFFGTFLAGKRPILQHLMPKTPKSTSCRQSRRHVYAAGQIDKRKYTNNVQNF